MSDLISAMCDDCKYVKYSFDGGSTKCGYRGKKDCNFTPKSQSKGDKKLYYDTQSIGTHKIKVTLQNGEYKGHISFYVKGNCHGLSILNFDFECDSDIIDCRNSSNDCDLSYNEIYDKYTVRLSDDNGDTLLLEEMSANEMNDMIVGLEIIDFIS